MKKKFWRLGTLLLTLSVFALAACGCSLAADQEGRRFEGGSRLSLGAINVVDLRGTWREMGRQYGALLAPELKHVYETAIIGKVAAKRPENAALMRATADGYYASAPFRYRELIAGMAETSGLSMEQLTLVNSVEMVSGLSQCAGIAAWGAYAAGPLVYGRNYDYFPDWFKKLGQDVVVAVFHPGDGLLSALTIGYAGEMYAVNGLNERGIFIELNNGTPSGGSVRFTNRTHVTQSLFALLFEASDMKYVDSFFHTTNASGAFIIGVSDGDTAKAYEWATFGVVDSSVAGDGLMAITNMFVDKSWGLVEPSDKKSWLGLSRRKNLLLQAEKNKGKMNAASMMAILDMPYEQGGATLATATMYQIVAMPKSRELWLKVSGVQDWTKIDAASLLAAK